MGTWHIERIGDKQRTFEQLTFNADRTLSGLRKWQLRQVVTIDGQEQYTDWEDRSESPLIYDSILIDKIWTERRTIFYNEEEMDSIGEGPMIEDTGIACGYAGCRKIEFLSNHRFKKTYPWGEVCLGSWNLKDDVLTIIFDKRERKGKKKYRFKIKYREKEECPTLYLFEIKRIACYIFCDYRLEKS